MVCGGPKLNNNQINQNFHLLFQPMKLDQALIAGSNSHSRAKTMQLTCFMNPQEYLHQVCQIFEDSDPTMQLPSILNLDQTLHKWMSLEINGSSCILVTVQT